MTTRRLAVVLEVDDGADADEEQCARDYMVELVEDAGFAPESVVSAIWLPAKNEPGPWEQGLLAVWRLKDSCPGILSRLLSKPLWKVG